MSNYWEKRAARQMYEQMQETDDFLKYLAKYYFAASQEIQRRAKAILNKFRLKNNISKAEAERILNGIDPDNIPALIAALEKDPKNEAIKAELTAQANAARVRGLRDLFEDVKRTMENIAERTEKGSKGLIKRLAREAYYKARYLIQKRANAGRRVDRLDDEKIENVTKQSWAGSRFSKRIWDNTEELEKAVKKEVMTNLLTGRSVEESAKAINEQFGKGMNNARRLMRTEMAYVSNQMALEGYRAEGVEKYIYVAILDLKTSKICQSLDKKTFMVKDAQAGKNFPPMHPWCRSTTIAWMPDHLLAKLQQKAIDPKTGKRITVPGNMTYEEWYKKFVEDDRPMPKATPATSRNLTLDQYNRYKARLGSDFPFSYKDFIAMKANKTEWAKWQQKFREAKQ